MTLLSKKTNLTWKEHSKLFLSLVKDYEYFDEIYETEQLSEHKNVSIILNIAYDKSELQKLIEALQKQPYSIKQINLVQSIKPSTTPLPV